MDLQFKRYQKCIVFGVGILLALGAVRTLYTLGTTVPVMADVTTIPTIILDPGHGGMDGGAVGVDGIVEKEINLNICLIMREMFAVSGFDVVMTRETDISIHDEGVTGVRKQKTSDLHNRLAIVQQQPNAVFVSLHQNQFTSSSSRGAQVFYGPKNAQSQRLAQIIQDNFVEDLQPDNQRAIKEAGEDLFLMTNAECPSVLVECGFLSNHDEAHRLNDPDYQAQIAFTTYRSVLEFLDMSVPAVPDLPEQSTE